MTVVYSPIKVRVEDGEILDVEITFEEHQLKAICGNEVIEKYRRVMDRFQTSDNETIAERERKQRRHRRRRR